MSALRSDASKLARLLGDAPQELIDSIRSVHVQPSLTWPINIYATGDEATAHKWHLYVGGYRMAYTAEALEDRWIASVCGDRVSVTVTEPEGEE